MKTPLIIRHIENFFRVGTYFREFRTSIRQNIANGCDNYVGNYFAQKIVDSHPEYYEELCKLLTIKEPEYNFVRIGKDNDGGYILVDDFKKTGGIAYSFGIGKDVSFDEDIANRGYDVFMYDYSIKSLPKKHSKFHFFKYKIGNGKDCKTLHDLFNENGHLDADKMILKIDIEGFEYELIHNSHIEDLSKFAQIVIEFHDVTSYTNLLIKPVLEKINECFQCVHIHGQDVSPIVRIGRDKILPYYIEVTYLNKSMYAFTQKKHVLPLDIDMPTYNGRRELYLGDFS